MKKFLSLVLAVVVIAVIVSNKAEIAEFIDGVLDSANISVLDDVTDEQIPLGSEYKNHFNALNSDQKKAYNHILTQVLTAQEEFPSTIEVPMMTGEELTEVFQAVLYDNPTVICIGRDNQILTSNELCYFQPNYIMTPEQQREKNQQIDAVCETILADIPSDADEFEKELIIHDYIVNNCIYDVNASDSSSTAYSCIVEGYSACEGYSKAAKILLEKAGIECYTISGDSQNFDGETEGHMWNIVNIDGEYYHLDVTWDDPTTQDGIETLSHLFMNVTDEDISVDHSNYRSDFICNSTDANYFIKTDMIFDSFGNADSLRLKKLIARSDGRHLEIKFSSEDVYNHAFDSLINNSEIYNIIEDVNKTYSKDFNTESIRYIETPERNSLDLFFN